MNTTGINNFFIQNINTKTPKNRANLNFCAKKLPFDEFSSSKKDENSRVSVKEGVKLILGGAKDKIKNMASSFIKHPVLTIASIGFSSMVLSLLPLIGISTAAGAGVLGLSFGAISAFKMAKNVKNAVSHAKKGENADLREDLRQIGATGVDLALSLNKKVLKRNLKAVKYQAKYGKIGIRKDLIKTIKEAGGIKKKFDALDKANKIVTDEINIFAGLDELQKELKFSDEIKKEYLKLYEIDDKEEFIQAAYNRLIEDLGYKTAERNFAPTLVFDYSDNPAAYAAHMPFGNNITFFMKSLPNRELTRTDKLELLMTQRHELKHFQQIVDIERAKGLGGTNALSIVFRKQREDDIAQLLGSGEIKPGDKVYEAALDKNSTLFLTRKKEFKNGKYYSTGENEFMALNEKQRNNFFHNIKKIAEKQGEIKRGSKEFRTANKFFEAWVNYPEVESAFTENMSKAQRIGLYMQLIKNILNPLEVDAQRAEFVLAPVENLGFISKMDNFRAMVPFNSIKKDEANS